MNEKKNPTTIPENDKKVLTEEELEQVAGGRPAPSAYSGGLSGQEAYLRHEFGKTGHDPKKP
ncbi:bacteriocin [Acutalibacter sp. 1XD8-33]|uniref:bacteriocin n=1 Tax=Acutalibacter sp. 1XD8-33 TaxID=2320081 RepID=UPI000EA2CAB9|nr:bacteriocin [Acutalibacter sp. 1XD8-33]RKJ39145.1 bacteriocin [Acutalibacter sp. 1XD8-33]